MFIIPRIPDLDRPSGIVQISESVESMGAISSVNIINIKLSKARSVEGPDAPVATYDFSIGLLGHSLVSYIPRGFFDLRDGRRTLLKLVKKIQNLILKIFTGSPGLIALAAATKRVTNPKTAFIVL